MKIGDVVAWPKGVPFEPELIRRAKLMRGTDARAAKSRAKNQRSNKARKNIEVREEDRRRLSDPFEQARIYLGRRGIAVFSAAIYDETFGPATAEQLISRSDWVVDGGRYPSRDSVIRRARIEGWNGEPVHPAPPAPPA